MPSGGVHTITHCGPSAVSGWPGEIGRSSPSFADGLQLSSERRRAAYDVWPVTAATMIRGIALTSGCHGSRDHRSEFRRPGERRGGANRGGKKRRL